MQAISHIDKKAQDALQKLAKDIAGLCGENNKLLLFIWQRSRKGLYPGQVKSEHPHIVKKYKCRDIKRHCANL